MGKGVAAIKNIQPEREQIQKAINLASIAFFYFCGILFLKRFNIRTKGGKNYAVKLSKNR
jgi:hypothetical protein